ncbi:MAG: hypothetical protein VXZ38_06380 [Planctomycetota bacterium]|nr:hypothetical protein [Planctomycetota bacterium]
MNSDSHYYNGSAFGFQPDSALRVEDLDTSLRLSTAKASPATEKRLIKP